MRAGRLGGGGGGSGLATPQRDVGAGAVPPPFHAHPLTLPTHPLALPSHPPRPYTQVTLGYNSARVKEAAGQLAAAEAEYRALLEQFPQYGDCLLRLSHMARARGDMQVRACVRAGGRAGSLVQPPSALPRAHCRALPPPSRTHPVPPIHPTTHPCKSRLPSGWRCRLQRWGGTTTATR